MELARTSTWGALALAALLAGCGGGSDEPTRIEGNTATVYSSAPQHGVSAAAARAVVAGERRALADADGRAGSLRIRLRELPTTNDAPDDPWDPALVSTNAHRAVDDPSAIAYLGELDYGASAVSLPITNDAGLLQVSPGDGLTSLTQRPPGRPRAGPERYYPSDERTFVRVGPPTWMRRGGSSSASARAAVSAWPWSSTARSTAASWPGRSRRSRGGTGSSRWPRRSSAETRTRSPTSRSELADARPDAVIYLGVANADTAPLLDEVGSALPAVPLLAPSGILAADELARSRLRGPDRGGRPHPCTRAGRATTRCAWYSSPWRRAGATAERAIAAALRLRPHVAAARLAIYRPGADGRFERVGAAR